MRAPVAIGLVLMGGGGLVLWSAGHRRDDACAEARAKALPNMEEICARSASRGGSGHGTASGSGSSGASRSSSHAADSAGTTAVSSTARGGFGASAAHAAAGS